MPKGYRLPRTGLPMAGDGQEAPTDGRDGPLEDFEEITGGGVDLDNLNWADAIQTLGHWFSENSTWITEGTPAEAGSDYPPVLFDTSGQNPSIKLNDGNSWVSEFALNIIGRLRTVSGGHNNGGLTIEGTQIRGPNGKRLDFGGGTADFAGGLTLGGNGITVSTDENDVARFEPGADDNNNTAFTYRFDGRDWRLYAGDNFGESGVGTVLTAQLDGDVDVPNGTLSQDGQAVRLEGDRLDGADLSFDPLTENEAQNRREFNDTGQSRVGRSAMVWSREVDGSETVNIEELNLSTGGNEAPPAGLDVVFVRGDESNGYVVESTLLSGGNGHGPVSVGFSHTPEDDGDTVAIAVDNGRFGSGVAENGEPSYSINGYYTIE